MAYEHMKSYPRVMARIGTDEPIELCRAKPGKRLDQNEINLYTIELAPCWTWWIEETTKPRDLVGTRPVLVRIGAMIGANTGPRVDPKTEAIEHATSIPPPEAFTP